MDKNLYAGQFFAMKKLNTFGGIWHALVIGTPGKFWGGNMAQTPQLTLGQNLIEHQFLTNS